MLELARSVVVGKSWRSILSFSASIVGVQLLAGCDDGALVDQMGTDVAAPATVTDLVASVQVADSTVWLSWTAVGDDGKEGKAFAYDVRFSADELSEDSWESAEVIRNPPAPSLSGADERFSVGQATAATTVDYGVKVVDENGNQSMLSNVATIAVTANMLDITPPSATVLSIEAVSDSTIDVSWEAPGDDADQGVAASYSVRIARTPISKDTWESAGVVADVPAPEAPGTTQSVTVQGLNELTKYYLAIRTVDDAGNWSDFAPSSSATTGERGVGLVYASDDVIGELDWRGGTIVFESLGRLWKVNADGSSQGAIEIQTDLGSVPHTSPRVSPNGTKVAFTVVSDSSRIYRTSIDGGAATEVAAGWTAAWSPNNLEIAYVAYGFGLWHVWVGGGEPTAVDVLCSSCAPGTLHDWSPDGASIMFQSVVPPEGGGGGLFIVPSAGGVAAWVAPHSSRRGRWSPDGTLIVVERGGDLVLMTPTGSVDWLAVRGGGVKPTWGPVGDEIAFVGTRMGTYGVWRARWTETSASK
ncbi:fibronectin type III domain-containing protein [bacterium]|nr:fibronectin type III domain-containing protein [bacterium]